MLHSVGEHARWVESSNLVGALGELNLSKIKCLVRLLHISEGSIYNRKVLFVTFLLIYGSRSVFMGIHGSRLVIHSSRLVLMVFIGSRLVFHVSRLVVHGFS